MKYKIYIVAVVYLLSNLVFATNDTTTENAVLLATAKGATKDPNSDLNEWRHTVKETSKKGQEIDPLVPSTSTHDPNSYFEIKREETGAHIRVLQDLSSVIEQFVAERQVAGVNSRAYNVGSKGEPAPGEPDLELFDTHIKLFCSPLSGYEGQIFKECNKANPLILQHADLKPIVLSNNRFSSKMIPIVRNYIDNFLVSPINSNLPDYIKDPSLISNAVNREKYIHRLRNQIPIAAAANSLNVMLAKRIPIDPNNEDSPSLASSLAGEVKGRHLSSEWHEAIEQSTSDLDIKKEELRVLGLISYQIHELNERLERIELLNASLVTSITNQQEIINELKNKN